MLLRFILMPVTIPIIVCIEVMDHWRDGIE